MAGFDLEEGQGVVRIMPDCRNLWRVTEERAVMESRSDWQPEVGCLVKTRTDHNNRLLCSV